jgi:5,5'-dehydrodivanillate O-demethylase
MPPTADFTDFAHTGPGTLAGRFMRTFWQPVYRGQDLPSGRAMPIRVMGEDFTLYRGQGGAAHVVAFRCAHRGTQLSTGWVEGDDIRCFYHGWKYDGSGRCVDQPAEDEGFKAKVSIRSYPTAEYLGLIFAYLGEGQAPPLPRYPEFEDAGVVEAEKPVVWPCNFFNRLENSPDTVHLAFVHRDSPFSENGLVDVPEVASRETEYGIETASTRPGGKVRLTHFHMPNINLISGSPAEPGGPWSYHLSWRVPVDDESCASYIVDFTALTGEKADAYRARRAARPPSDGPVAAQQAEAVLRGDVRIADLADRSRIVNVQDYVAQVGQGAIAPREADRLGRSDVGVILLRKLWSREMRALAEGQPLKPWRRSERVDMAVGV